jgi:NifU-like protein involved in Fe-S cluster formation
MLVLDIVNRDFENTLDILNRAEAIKLLDTIQMQAARSGLANMTMKEIDAEIADYRKEKKGSK